MPETNYRVSNHAVRQFMVRSGMKGSVTMADREMRRMVDIGKHMVPLENQRGLDKLRNEVLAYNVRAVVSGLWAFIFKDCDGMCTLVTCYVTGESKWEEVEYVDEAPNGIQKKA